MSASGPKRTCLVAAHMSAFGVKRTNQNCTDNDGTAQCRALGKVRIDNRGDFQNTTHVAELPILLWRLCDRVVTVDASLHHHGICHGHTYNMPSVKHFLTGIGLLWISH